MRNFESRRHGQKVSSEGGEMPLAEAQIRRVTDSEPDWQLQAWMRYRDKRQADLVKELGWPKARVNKYFHGHHPYRRDVLNELSRWLGIEPFELLMPPEEAVLLRRLRDAAHQVVSGLPMAPERGRAVQAAAPKKPG